LVRRTPKAQQTLGGSLVADDDGFQAVDDDDDLAMDRVVQAHDVSGLGLSSSSAAAPLKRFNRSYNAAASGERQQFGYDGDEEVEPEEPKEPPPENYHCHRCGLMGVHWIWECPSNDDPEHMKKVRPAKGIPRQFLKKVTLEEGQEQSAGGVTFTLPGHSGHYIYSHEASQEEKKRRLGDTVQEKVTAALGRGASRVEDALRCPLCNQLFKQAVLAPCCGETFCSGCAIDRLAHSSVENSNCPSCSKEVLVHQLIANEDIRRLVDQVTKASKASALAVQKDRGNAKLAAAAGQAGGSHAEPLLALTDGTSNGTPAAVADWQPLGIGPLLSPEQFASWKQRLSAGSGNFVAAKEQFEEWQRSVKAAAAGSMAFPHHPGYYG